MTIPLGTTARELRESLGLTQRAAAAAIGVSAVHLRNVESDKRQPSQALLDRYRELWGIDLYVLAWSTHGDVSQLPRPLRAAARALSDRWKRHIDKLLGQHKADA